MTFVSFILTTCLGFWAGIWVTTSFVSTVRRILKASTED